MRTAVVALVATAAFVASLVAIAGGWDQAVERLQRVVRSSGSAFVSAPLQKGTLLLDASTSLREGRITDAGRQAKVVTNSRGAEFQILGSDFFAGLYPMSEQFDRYIAEIDLQVVAGTAVLFDLQLRANSEAAPSPFLEIDTVAQTLRLLDPVKELGSVELDQLRTGSPFTLSAFVDPPAYTIFIDGHSVMRGTRPEFSAFGSFQAHLEGMPGKISATGGTIRVTGLRIYALPNIISTVAPSPEPGIVSGSNLRLLVQAKNLRTCDATGGTCYSRRTEGRVDDTIRVRIAVENLRSVSADVRAWVNVPFFPARVLSVRGNAIAGAVGGAFDCVVDVLDGAARFEYLAGSTREELDLGTVPVPLPDRLGTSELILDGALRSMPPGPGSWRIFYFDLRLVARP